MYLLAWRGRVLVSDCQGPWVLVACGPFVARGLLAGATLSVPVHLPAGGYNGLSSSKCYEVRTTMTARNPVAYPPQLRPHPAEIREAIQAYIERQCRPVRTFDVQDVITKRLDTYHGKVASELRHLEQDGKICKHISPETGTEYWFSPKSDLFCGTCGQLALPGVHTEPDCPRRKQ